MCSSDLLIRWRLYLQQFRFAIEHIPGGENSFADFWSRIHCQHVISYFSAQTAAISATTSEKQPPPVTSDTFHVAYEKSDAYLVPGIPNDILAIIARHHNSIVGHHGVNATIRRLRSTNEMFPHCHRYVRQYIQHCPVCQKSRSTLADLPVVTSTEHFSEPFARVQIDTLGPFPEDSYGFAYIEAIICECTAYVELYPTRAATAEESARAINSVVGRYGPPYAIRSDNGPTYTAAVTQEL